MIFTSRPTFRFPLRPMTGKALALAGLLAALHAAPVFADEVGDVNKLVRAGQYAEALSKAEAYLGKHPRDAQMRFLKGVILTEQNRSAEAITIFSKLTEDYPTLPEPYNNLAVLYAAAGQYEKARTALDAAIRTNPAYATAYENLGDVHAKLASQAYDKALQLDSGNSTAKSKLTLVHTLVGSMDGGNAKAAAATAAAPARSAQQAQTPVAPSSQGKVAAIAPAPASPKPAAAAPAAPERPAAVAVAKPEPVQPQPKAKPESNPEQDDVLAVVHGWAKAWSSQDVKSYLAFYGNDFQTPKGLSRKAWEQERRARIAGKDRISVKVESPQVTFKGDTATVRFRQAYVSDRLTANTRKTLVLAKQGGRWKIKQEQAGS
ncbi:L,D-transpeptidase Cds6 family protein [Noviherbaspirillum massiliense]|uniref:L,D-transpeptidase Cds6 family protein n=1 Tax=Noviherbaspirillum massiliense TaxID=1465823 RepID=UPI00036FB42C|nr:tetratricopeptide repeat protein [Noviherbaspirillum massiliense]